MQRKRKGRRSRRHDRDDGGSGKGGGNSGSGGGGADDGDIRFRVQDYLAGTPGSRLNPERESVFIITAAQGDGSIETIAFNMRDTKAIIIDGLIALSSFNHEFASYLLERYFRTDSPHRHDDWGNNNS